MKKQTKTVKVVLGNVFHNTEKRVRLLRGQKNVIQGARMRSWEKALCGVGGCCCSGYAGLKGDEFTAAVHTEDGVHLDWEYSFDPKQNQTVLLIWA